ncbi:MAG: SDR family NAD(P)-dependent oxidoreductase [Gemmatimonadaceae bacterium]|nr:SDR family NAD(P)-dependent oxidoreductase [Gemmatimonadaceae bacterium]
MKVLITGGAGFIGSHLAERLVERGDEVVALDDLSSGSAENVAHLEAHPGFALVIGSAADASVVETLVERCDTVIHLAAAVGVRLILERPVYAIENNLFATAVVLDAAAKARKAGDTKLVLIASTSEVYGKGSSPPFREDDDLTLGPTRNSRWAYACSKAMDEWLGLAYYREHGVPTIIARFFNTVGPRQTGRYGMVLPNFTQQALDGDPITVFGTGDQSRCFCHVRDVVEAVVRLIATPRAVGEVFNIGSDREISMRGLAELVRDTVSSRSPIKLVPYDEAYADGFEDMLRRVPDTSKLERYIAFRPMTTLEEIVADVIADRRGRMSMGDAEDQFTPSIPPLPARS